MASQEPNGEKIIKEMWDVGGSAPSVILKWGPRGGRGGKIPLHQPDHGK